MDVLTAILACSLHLDDQLVRAIVEIQSEGHEFFVGDLTELASDDSTRTLEAARAAGARLKVKGHRPAFGLMGVPPEWARSYNHDPERLWDACVNISIGTAKLSEFDYECRHQKRDVVRRRGHRRLKAVTSSQNRTCILKKYAAELGIPPVFIGAVLAEALKLKTSSTSPSTAAPTETGWNSDFPGTKAQPSEVHSSSTARPKPARHNQPTR